MTEREKASGDAIYIVSERLKRWGAFYVRELDECCGGAPRNAAFLNIAQGVRDKTYSSNGVIDAEIIDTNSAVLALKEHDSLEHKLIRDLYTSREDSNVIARKHSLSMRRLQQKAKEAKKFMAGWLRIKV